MQIYIKIKNSRLLIFLLRMESLSKIDDNIQKDVLTYDLKGKMVSHNFIDMHVHLREPGFEHKEIHSNWKFKCFIWWLWNNW